MTDLETWTCDKRRLNDKLAHAMLDREFSEKFHQQGAGILDRLCGEGTAEAFRHSSNDRVAMRFDPFRDKLMGSIQGQRNQMLGCDMGKGRDQMAMYNSYTGVTSGNACTTSTTTSATTSDYWITDAVKSELKKAVKKQVNTKKPMRPFTVEHGGDLISSLQRHFDLWAKPQMRLLHG